MFTIRRTPRTYRPSVEGLAERIAPVAPLPPGGIGTVPLIDLLPPGNGVPPGPSVSDPYLDLRADSILSCTR